MPHFAVAAACDSGDTRWGLGAWRLQRALGGSFSGFGWIGTFGEGQAGGLSDRLRAMGRSR
jgi:hypothetical protein